MTCDLCSKNEATVHLTEVVNDQTRELHLCESCAREKGQETQQYFTGGLAELLAGLSDLGTKLPGGAAVQGITCPKCGLTYEDFKKVGRLGCDECYDAFHRVLGPLLKRIHGSTQYLGKLPPAPATKPKPAAPAAAAATAEPKPDLAQLKEQLKAAVAAESFEEAVRLRDKIRILEGKQKRIKERE